MIDLSTLNPEVAGFGNCAVCPYRETAPPALCFTCARQSMERLASNKCEICDHPLEKSSECNNPICGWTDRFFEWNYAVAMRSGPLERAINAYKYNDRRAWAQIFARVLVGFLDKLPKTFRRFDLIIASPTYVARDGSSRTWDHTGRVIQLAYESSNGNWPFDIVEPRAIIKTANTTPMQGKTWKQRDKIAREELRPALQIPIIPKTRDKKILVYDDVFTDGHTLNEVARCLRLKGYASEVCGVTLARQRFRSR